MRLSEILTHTKRHDYLSGDCMVYAVAFCNIKGGQLVGIFDDVWNTIPRHVGVKIDNSYYDARGKLSKDDFLKGFEGSNSTIKSVSEKRLRDIFRSRNWDLSSVELSEQVRFPKPTYMIDYDDGSKGSVFARPSAGTILKCIGQYDCRGIIYEDGYLLVWPENNMYHRDVYNHHELTNLEISYY